FAFQVGLQTRILLAQGFAFSHLLVESLLEPNGFALFCREAFVEGRQLRGAVGLAVFERAFGPGADRHPGQHSPNDSADQQNENGNEIRHEESVYQKRCKDETAWQSRNSSWSAQSRRR